MKLIFTEQEIIEFFKTKRDEIVADEIIIKATVLQKPDFSNDKNNIEMIETLCEAAQEIGKAEGNMSGRIKLLCELVDLFEFDK